MPQQIEVSCPHCNRKLRISGDTAGKQIKCPQCQFIISVPEVVIAANDAHPGPPLAARWSVKAENGQVYGPVSRQELDQWVQEGRVNERTQLINEGSQEWLWAGDIFPQFSRPISSSAMPQPLRAAHTGPVSDRSRLIAGLLGILLPFIGIFGVHRFYLGHIGIGILQLITFGGCMVWQIIDVILVFAGSVRDADGLPLRE